MPNERSLNPKVSVPFSCLPHVLAHQAKCIPDAPAVLAPEREPPVHREYTWPDVPVRAGGTKTERRLLGLGNVHSAWFSLTTHAILRTFAVLYQKPTSILSQSFEAF